MKLDQNQNIEKIRSFLSQKEKMRRKLLDEKYKTALKDFEKIVEIIKTKYKPTRIYQWGSLLDKDKFREYSDIDIAIEGLKSPEQFFKLLGEIETLTNFPIDLVELDKIRPEFAEIIKRKGKLIYEKTN